MCSVLSLSRPLYHSRPYQALSTTPVPITPFISLPSLSRPLYHYRPYHALYTTPVPITPFIPLPSLSRPFYHSHQEYQFRAYRSGRPTVPCVQESNDLLNQVSIRCSCLCFAICVNYWYVAKVTPLPCNKETSLTVGIIFFVVLWKTRQ